MASKAMTDAAFAGRGSDEMSASATLCNLNSQHSQPRVPKLISSWSELLEIRNPLHVMNNRNLYLSKDHKEVGCSCNHLKCPINVLHPWRVQHPLMDFDVLSKIKIAVPCIRVTVRDIKQDIDIDIDVLLHLVEAQPRLEFTSKGIDNFKLTCLRKSDQGYCFEITKTISRTCRHTWRSVVIPDKSGSCFWNPAVLAGLHFKCPTVPDQKLTINVEYQLLRDDLLGTQPLVSMFYRAVCENHIHNYDKKIRQHPYLWMADMRLRMLSQANRKMHYGVDLDIFFQKHEIDDLTSAVSTPFHTLELGPRTHRENTELLTRAGFKSGRLMNINLKMTRPRKLPKREREERESRIKVGPRLKRRAFDGTDEQRTAISLAVTSTFGFGSIWSKKGEDNFFLYNSKDCVAEQVASIS